jgi:hypothetical protein
MDFSLFSNEALQAIAGWTSSNSRPQTLSNQDTFISDLSSDQQKAVYDINSGNNLL